MQKAIIALQNKLNLEADGVFGKNTIIAASKLFNLSRVRAAHFFGQCAHETGNFTVFEENLNYSSGGLLKVFPKYFNTETAKSLQKKPELIANKVYANRMGNGDEKSGDGYKYRGRGAIQLTGKNNYTKFGSSINRDLIFNPDLVSGELAFESALFFFNENSIWTICDKGIDTDTITKLTKRVNGGTIGLDDRIVKTQKFYSLLGE